MVQPMPASAPGRLCRRLCDPDCIITPRLSTISACSEPGAWSWSASTGFPAGYLCRAHANFLFYRGHQAVVPSSAGSAMSDVQAYHDIKTNVVLYGALFANLRIALA